MGPGGDLIVNTSRVTVSQITSSNKTYSSSLHFTSLFEDDAEVYLCIVIILETSVLTELEIQSIVGMYLYISKGNLILLGHHLYSSFQTDLPFIQ